eukprot:NODE_615_length_5971_cov_0.202486.p6 type:complete len:111 gc:universal NODE_615_length_5971_cov_0.202486:5493-5161(-)
MCRKFIQFPNPPYYHCNACFTPLATRDDLISRNFQSRSGEAYMFSYAYNVENGIEEEKQMITGRYNIKKVFCSKCLQEVGWLYLHSHDLTQKYKEEKYVLEKYFLAEISQ